MHGGLSLDVQVYACQNSHRTFERQLIPSPSANTGVELFGLVLDGDAAWS